MSVAIFSAQGRSPGSSGLSVALTAALRSSDVRRGRGPAGVSCGRGAVATGAVPGCCRRPRLRLRWANGHSGDGLAQGARRTGRVGGLGERPDDRHAPSARLVDRHDVGG